TELLQGSNLNRLAVFVEHRANFGRCSDAVCTGCPVSGSLGSGLHDWSDGLLVAHLLDSWSSSDAGLAGGCSIGSYVRFRGAATGFAFVEHGADFGRGGYAVLATGSCAACLGLTCRGKKSERCGSDK